MDELIKRIKSGDMSGWDALVAKYQQKALNFAHRMLRDRFEAEDAVQEAFIKAFDKINLLRDTSSFSTWFFTILNNICLDILRKRKRSADTVSITQTDKDDEDFELQIEDRTPGPDEKLQKKEAQKVLEHALTLLSDEHRAVIILRDINDFEYDEIAKILKISLGTVKSRISRARQALKKILEDNKELFQ